MDRRSTLRLVGLAAVGLAGCGRPDTLSGEPPTPPASYRGTPTRTPGPDTPTPRPTVDALRTSAADITFAEGENGTVTLTFPVENVGDEAATGELVAVVEVNGTDRTRAQVVSVDAGETREFTLDFGGDWDEFDLNLQSATFYETP